MRLNVAVQMDPIERINIRGDSTFALLLEAQARAYPISYYTPEQLVGTNIVVVANLEPAVLRGVESQGMLLAAQDGPKVLVLRPDGPAAPGSRVS